MKDSTLMSMLIKKPRINHRKTMIHKTTTDTMEIADPKITDPEVTDPPVADPEVMDPAAVDPAVDPVANSIAACRLR